MKTLINPDLWNRKEHFLFFSQFEEPFFGIVVNVDCTIAFQQAKQKGTSFFLYYLYRALKAANSVENFRYRVVDGQVYLFEKINASPTINRPDNTFGFAYMDYDEDESVFYEKALEEIKAVRASGSLLPAVSGENVIHFSAIPWLSFTSISHARRFSFPDSCPKISFGKMIEDNRQKLMPVSVHVHHGLVDGYHVASFTSKFQELLNEMS